MSLIGSDTKQYQMANQQRERLDVTVGTLQDGELPSTQEDVFLKLSLFLTCFEHYMTFCFIVFSIGKATLHNTQ